MSVCYIGITMSKYTFQLSKKLDYIRKALASNILGMVGMFLVDLFLTQQVIHTEPSCESDD